MNEAKRRLLWGFADKVRAPLNLETPLTINSLRNAIERMGGELVERPSTALEASIARVEGGRFRILLDSDKQPERQLFSLAHELGHLFVHMGFGRAGKWDNEPDYVESYARSGYDEEELEANEFAASLLMPRDQFINIVTNSGLNQAATHFGVSKQAALMRARWLKLEPWK